MAKKKEEAEYSVILDTSFMIRLLSESEKLHPNALGYFRYFLDHSIPMYFSTVSVAEYCVRGDFYDLPFQNIRILPFNIFHAKEAGRFADALFKAKSKGLIDIPNRLIIPNDSKIFAQGAVEKDILYFVTADVKSKNNIEILRQDCAAEINHLDINIPHCTFWIVRLGLSPIRILLFAFFCKNRGYNRKNLYLCTLLIMIFCIAVKVNKSHYWLHVL